MEMWRDRAACRGRGVAPWFAGKGTHEGRKAATLCWLCPVRTDCLQEALKTETTDATRVGIRGGLGPAERGALDRE